MNDHYICHGGCNGVTETVGATCQAQGCADYGKPLHVCSCEDGTHEWGSEKTAEARRTPDES